MYSSLVVLFPETPSLQGPAVVWVSLLRGGLGSAPQRKLQECGEVPREGGRLPTAFPDAHVGSPPGFVKGWTPAGSELFEGNFCWHISLSQFLSLSPISPSFSAVVLKM